MFWIFIYLLTWLPAAMILGRMAAEEYRQSPRTSTQVSALSIAIVYGLMWPIVMLILCSVRACMAINEGDALRPLRVFFTGTDEK